MKNKLVEILIVVAALLVLVGCLVLCFGCKEKAEAKEITICANCPHIGWFGEPNSCEKYRASLKESNGPDYLFHPIAIPNWEYSNCSECGKKSHISQSHYCFQVILKNIPTWPEYIELEKDLEIQWPDPNDGYMSFLIHLTKGTKIYFKDD